MTHPHTCCCCGKTHQLEDAGDVLGFICPNCWWEWDHPELPETCISPNGVTLEEAKRNYALYGACNPHGFWCKTGGDLPPELIHDERCCDQCENISSADRGAVHCPCCICRKDRS